MAEDAIARARAIAARLASGGSAGPSAAGGDSELGKRKNRWDDDQQGGRSNHSGLGMQQKRKVYVPVHKYPEINFMGLLIGPRGRTQKDLEQRTGARIYFRGRGASKDGMPTGHPDDDDDLHISVEGPADCVSRAVDELDEILHNPAKAEKLKQEQLKNLHDLNNSSGQSGGQLSVYGPGNNSSEKRLENGEMVIDLKVPNGLVGYVIGKGGENIQKMQAQTGGHIQIAKESEMKPGETLRNVSLSGSERAVNELKRRIDELISEKMNGGRDRPVKSKDQDHSFVLKVAVPNDKVGVIIGKSGIVVKGIQERTGCNIMIPTEPDEDNPSVRTLSIGAESREAVDAAQMEIFMVLQQQAVQTSMYIAIPDDKVGIVIGKGGATIKEMQNKHGCRIQIPPIADLGSDPPSRTISISGPPDKQLLTKLEIETIMGLRGNDDAWGQYGNDSYDPYAAQYAAAQAAPQDPATIDPTSYYPDFWAYASLYGEEAARAYYTTWSPPFGTPPPPGIVLPQLNPVVAAAPASNEQAATAKAGAAEELSPEAVAAAWALYYEQMAQYQAQVPSDAAAGVNN